MLLLVALGCADSARAQRSTRYPSPGQHGYQWAAGGSRWGARSTCAENCPRGVARTKEMDSLVTRKLGAPHNPATPGDHSPPPAPQLCGSQLRTSKSSSSSSTLLCSTPTIWKKYGLTRLSASSSVKALQSSSCVWRGTRAEPGLGRGRASPQGLVCLSSSLWGDPHSGRNWSIFTVNPPSQGAMYYLCCLT